MTPPRPYRCAAPSAAPTALAAFLVLAAPLGRAAAQAPPEPPRLVALEPAHLTTGIDPAECRELVLRFDQDMDPAVHSLCGGGAAFPKVAKTAWRDARTFVLEVELAADRVYTIEVACAGTAGFRAKTGAALAPAPWRFATRGERLPDGVAAAATARLFASIRDQYSYRDRLGIDWSELERTRHDALATAPDGPTLALLTTELLATAQDVHVSVRWRDATLPTWWRPTAPNFDLRGLQAVLPKLVRAGKQPFTARTDDGIGYLFVGSFARDQQDAFERTLEGLRGLLDCQALVVDVRTNTGGDETLARRLAAFFVPGEKVYAGHRVRDAKATGGFREVEQRAVRGNAEPDVFTRPVAVLQGAANMSSCEAFLLMMKQAPQAILVGETSYGSSGNPVAHQLAPGLGVLLPSWQALRPDGTMFEGEGIAPHIHATAKARDLQHDDPVLREALLRLRDRR